MVALVALLAVSACGGARATGSSGAPTRVPSAAAESTAPSEPATPAEPSDPATPSVAASAASVASPAAPEGAAPLSAPQVRAAGGGLAGRTILLDAGHSGGNGAQPARLNALVPAGGFLKPCNTTGTQTDAGYPEHAFTFDVVARAAALLLAQGAKVVLTRSDDTGFGPCVNERAALGNAARADAVIAVHGDGGVASGYGFHVIAPALAPDGGNAAILGTSYRLALAVRASFQSATAEPYATYIASQGLTQRSDLAGLNLSRVPAVFIECGNMRNASDAARMSSPAWRQQAATGLVAALDAYLSH